jgi:hypothetical protein
MINHSAFIERQDSLDEVIYNNKLQSKESYSLVKLFKSFSSEETENIVSFFGDLGKRLKSFSTAVSENSIPCKNDLLVEAIQTYCYCNKAKMNNFLDIFKEEIIKNLNKDTEIKRIDNPFINNQFIRFIENKNQREELRKNKIMHEIGLSTFAKKGNWESYPVDFRFYERFNSDYFGEIERIKLLSEKYKNIGCNKLYEEISSTIESLEDLYNDNYLGFHRITLSMASIILARMHGYNVLKTDEEYHIVVDKKCLMIYQDDYRPSYYYKPKAYPLYELKTIVSERTNNLINYLENNSNLFGQAAFDHLIVLMPSVHFGKKDSERQEDELMSDKFLDIMLVGNKSFVPILLGEKDGKTYFISYFV